MRHNIFLMAGLCASIVFCQVAFEPAAYPQTSIETQGQTAGPGIDFQKAHESFLKKEFKASAAEIRKGADILKKETEYASDQGKIALSASGADKEKKGEA